MPATTEIESIVVQQSSGAHELWRFQFLDQLGLVEADLERAILAQPKSLIVDPLELPSGQIKAYPQTQLRYGNSQRKPDVIILTEHGDVVVVEVKRVVNRELKDGRQVIAQVVDYAALFANTPETEVVGALTKGQHSSWEAVYQFDFDSIDFPRRAAKKLRQRVSDGEIHLVVACDSAPSDLADWVRSASNLNALGFALHVVEVRPMAPVRESENRKHPIAWVPWPRLDTEIVHRTAVTVRMDKSSREGTPRISVDVSSDTADHIKGKLAASERDVPKHVKRKDEMLKVLKPMSDTLGMQAADLWDELGLIHQAVMEADWEDLRQAIAWPDDTGPYLRGNSEVNEGRIGVNLLQKWKPSVFVGAYLLDHDHKMALLDSDNGGDFVLILDVGKFESPKVRKDFYQHPCVIGLRERLSQGSGDWKFADNCAQPPINWYHPLFLRRPLASVIGGTSTPEQRSAQWLDAARDAVAVLMAGEELAEYRRQVGPE